MAQYLSSFIHIVFFVVGCVAVCMALLVSGSDYSQIIAGDAAKDLSWGPNLFRGLLFFHGALLMGISFAWEKLTKSGPGHRKLPKRNIAAERLGWTNLSILALISLVALGARLINLNSDLWVDEVFTLVDFVRLPMGQILTSFPNQNQHMFYSVLARISFDVFGESAWALRLPSVLFGVGSIWALYFLARRLIGNKAAIFSSALIAVSYHHIWFSQNARGYTGLLVFTLLATWFWFEALQKNTLFWWGFYTGAIVLGMWIHMTMAFVVAAHGLIYLILVLRPGWSGDAVTSESPERSAGIRPFVAWFLSVTATLQLYALSLPEFLRTGLHEESRNSLWTNPIWVLTETLQNLSIGFAGIAVVAVGAAFVFFGWFSLYKESRRAALMIILPPVLAGSFMLLIGHNLFPRFFFFAMGFGILIVVHGALQLPEFLGKSFRRFKMPQNVYGVAGGVLVSLMIAASAVTIPRNYALPKQDFSGAKEYVESQRKSGEGVVAVSLAGDMYGKYFAPEWSVAEDEEQLKNLQMARTTDWLVYTLSPEIKAFHPELWEMIEKDYEVVKVFPGTLNGGEVFICRRRSYHENRNKRATYLRDGQGGFTRHNGQ